MTTIDGDDIASTDEIVHNDMTTKKQMLEVNYLLISPPSAILEDFVQR